MPSRTVLFSMAAAWAIMAPARAFTFAAARSVSSLQQQLRVCQMSSSSCRSLGPRFGIDTSEVAEAAVQAGKRGGGGGGGEASSRPVASLARASFSPRMGRMAILENAAAVGLRLAPRWRGQVQGAKRMGMCMSTAGSSESRVDGAGRGIAGDGEEERETECIVRVTEGEPHMSIHFGIKGKERALSRMLDDEVEASLRRLGLLWAEGMGFIGGKRTRKKKPKKANGKGKNRRAEAEAGEDEEVEAPQVVEEVPIEVQMWSRKGHPVSDGALNRDAWKHGARVEVTRAGLVERYRVVENPPTVVSLDVDSAPLVGFPLRAQATFQHADEGRARWRWLKRADRGGFGRLEEVHVGEEYTPSAADVGAGLVVECTPVRGAAGGGAAGVEEDEEEMVGSARTHELDRAVRAGPDMSAHKLRFEHAESTDEEEVVRVVSYNILADNYASTRFARETLYAFCPEEFLEERYRKQLIASEILRYKPSIISLQEVTREVYDAYLLPTLKAGGYQGSYANKLGVSSIGCAMFWRASQYSASRSGILDLANGWKEHYDLAMLCSGSDPARVDMAVALERSTTVAQVVMLEGRDGRKVCSVNAHLFGHPDAHHVRLVQTAVMARGVDELLQREGWGGAAVVVCGDFNSLPEEGVRDFFVEGEVTVNHGDWWRGLKFKNIMSREEREQRWFEGSSASDERAAYAGRSMEAHDTRPCLFLGSPLGPLSRACLHVKATISTSAGPQVVDHIFFSTDGLEEAQDLFPAIPVEEITRDGGLPSARFPSDHIALVADLKWR